MPRAPRTSHSKAKPTVQFCTTRVVHAPPHSLRPTKNIRSTTASTPVVPNRSALASSPASGPVTATIRVCRQLHKGSSGCVRPRGKDLNLSSALQVSPLLLFGLMRCTYMVFKYQWVLGLGISRYQASPSPQTACVSRVTPTRSPSTTQIVSRSDCKSIVSPPVNFLPRCTVVMHCRVRASLLSHDSKHKHALRTKDMTTTP